MVQPNAPIQRLIPRAGSILVLSLTGVTLIVSLLINIVDFCLACQYAEKKRIFHVAICSEVFTHFMQFV